MNSLNNDRCGVEGDTQARLNKDASMAPDEYCKRFGLRVTSNGGFDMASQIKTMAGDLLRRQRALDAHAIGGE